MKLLLGLIKKNIKLTIYISLCILVFIIFITYLTTNFTYSSSNIDKYSDKEKIELMVKKIDTINSKLSSSLINNTLDTKAASTNLSNILNELNNCNVSISSLEMTSPEYQEVKNKLILCINSTSDLYYYCNLSLTSTEKDSVDIVTNNLEELKRECINDYNTLSSHGFQLKYTDTMDAFLSALIRYLANLNKVVLDKNCTKANIELFKKTLSTSINNFSPLLGDLEPALKKIHEDGRSLDVLIKDLDDKEKKFNEIKTNFTYIAIPNGYLPYYTSLCDTFNLYEKYLQALKIAIIYEKSADNSTDNKRTIDKNYKNAFNKYNDVLDSFNYVTKSLKNL